MWTQRLDYTQSFENINISCVTHEPVGGYTLLQPPSPSASQLIVIIHSRIWQYTYYDNIKNLNIIFTL